MSSTTISAQGVSTEPPPPPRTWLQRRLLDPLLGLLKAGLSPASLALTVGLGVAIGVVPLVGITTITAAAVALRLRLNVAAMQLVCHLLSPVQLLLLLPLLRFGGALMGRGDALAQLTTTEFERLLRHEPGQLVQLLWRAEVGALAIWAVASVPVVALLYLGLRPLFRRVLSRQAAKEEAKELGKDETEEAAGVKRSSAAT